MRGKDLIIAFSLASFTIALGLILYLEGLGPLPARDLRFLATSILKNIFNPWEANLTTYSLNAVSAVIWDYRALDTILETAVLFAAITGVTALFREFFNVPNTNLQSLSVVVRASTKVVLPLIVLVGTSLAIHGHLSPGGGFQGGAVLAVAPALLITVFSLRIVYDLKLKAEFLLGIRFSALLLIILLSLTPPILASISGVKGYVLQNMGKADSPLSMPAWFLNTPLAGSIFFFNVLETVAVVAGLTLCILLVSVEWGKIKNFLTRDENRE